MDRAESGSSPEATIGRSSSEEDRKRKQVVEGSSSSLDTVVGPGMEEKKKGRFGALKSSFRKEGGLFHLKKRNPKIVELDLSLDAEAKNEESARAKVAEKASNEEATPKPMKKKKKSHSLVRKLSLNKFRAPAEQSEQRRTPEGGDSSRSLSRSSPDSQSQSDLVSKNSDDQIEQPKKDEKSEPAKIVSTVTVIPQKSPQLTLSTNRTTLLSPERSAAVKKHFERVEENIAKTFPEAFDVWPPPGRETKGTNSESGSESEQSPRTYLAQRRKALAEERRAFFQRRKLDTSAITSGDTVIEVDIEDENRKRDKAAGQTQKKARQISVRKFDTFSTFEGTFDEDTGVGYLAGIEEARTSLDSGHRDGDQSYQNDMANIASSADGPRSVSSESASTQNNVPSSGVGEKREHLYKILVIGELGAGKTSIIKRYVHQFFSQHYRATIGVDFALKVLNWDPNTIIRLQLWDIAGQERFGNMTRVYYKEAVGAFIVFDVTRSATLDAVVKWKHDLDSKVQLPDGSPIPCVLLANKCDQQKEGLVNNPSKMDEYCKEKNFAGWFETSAKENVNIEEAARFLVGKILQNDVIMKGNESQDQNDNERFALNQPANGLKKTCSC